MLSSEDSVNGADCSPQRSVHPIRLRGPWEYEPLAQCRDGGLRDDDLPPGGRVTMPADWGATLGDDFRGRVRYRRPFGFPAELTGGERVWLVFEAIGGAARLWLNDEPLAELEPGATPARLEVTPRLEKRNVLVVEVELLEEGEADGSRGGLTGEVRLEIEETCEEAT